MTTVLIEESYTPIYQRIVAAIASALKKRGVGALRSTQNCSVRVRAPSTSRLTIKT